MTGPEHYRAAEHLLRILTKPVEHGLTVIDASMNPNVVAAAQAHAILALAAATAFCGGGELDAQGPAWAKVCGGAA